MPATRPVFEVENESGGEEHAGMMFGFTFLHYSGLTTDTRGSDQNPLDVH